MPILAQAKTYNTDMHLVENPISEHGTWTSGHAAGSSCSGFCWGNVKTDGTRATGADQPNTFGDPTAIVNGTWGQNQTLMGQVSINGTAPSSCCHEIELRPRTTISAASITGYEINCSVATGNPYIQIVRWNGGNGNFTQIDQAATTQPWGALPSCKNGDIFKVVVSGTSPTTIQAWLNGNPITFSNHSSTTVSDSTSPQFSGNPGIGMFDGVGGTFGYGFGAFYATDGVSMATGFIASSRSSTWDANAGLPWVLPDGEKTAKPWIPPARTTICSTVNSGNFSTLQTALNSCPAGQAVHVTGPGTFNQSSSITIPSNVTLRLDDNVTIKFAGSTGITLGSTNSNPLNSTSCTAGCTPGSTSLTFSSSVASMTPNQSLIALYYRSGDAGDSADTGQVYVCTTCFRDTAGHTQSQTVLVTGVSGNTATISPGLYMPNWSVGLGPIGTGGAATFGCGLEGGTIDGTAGASGISMAGYACWVKGVRFVGGTNQQIRLKGKNNLVMSNYFTGLAGVSFPEAIVPDTDSDSLVMNNWGELGPISQPQSGTVGDVYAYNYNRDSFSNSGNQCFIGNLITNHDSGESLQLFEGNQMGNLEEDNDHGSHNLDTIYRNLLQGNDPPYTKSCHVRPIFLDGFSRFMNTLGNVLGSGTTASAVYTTGNGTTDGSPFTIWNTPGGSSQDSLTINGLMRWGNYPVCTGSSHCNVVSFDSSEVPSALGGAAASFSNAVPASQNIPVSLFLPITGSFPSGGTNLSFWKVCTNYPTCSTFQVQPFPPIGPDVTGGSVIGGFNYAGHANDVPAAVAWKTLPVDPTYQTSYSITSSSYSNPNNTIAVSGLPTTPVGEFTITGTTGCNGTFVANNSTTTTVTYAVGSSNPGSCAGATFKWPNLRQFSATIFQADSAQVTHSFSLIPSSFSFGNQAIGVASSAQAFTLTNNGSLSSTISSITFTGTNPGDFSQTNTCGTLPVVLASNASCTINVKFTPAASGSRSSSLTVTDTPDSISASSSLSGTGINASCPQNQSVGAYTLCGENYNDVASGTSVTTTYSPVAGNGVIAWATWCYNSSCNSSTPGVTATIGDNINATESCFTLSPNSPFITNANGGAQGAGDFQEHFVWYCPSIPSGVTSFHVTPSSGSLSFLQLNVSEWLSGSLAATCSPVSACFETVDNLGQAGNGTGGTTATISTNGPTSNANNLLFAVTETPCCSFTASPGTGYTGITVAPSLTPGMVSEAKSVTSIGLQTATSTWTGGSTPWFGVIAPIKAFSNSSVSLSPSSVVFSTRVVGNSGPGQAITLNNTGASTVSITSIIITGTNIADFSQANNCGASLNAGANCTITVNFVPTALGSRSASVQVTDSAPGSPQSVPLSGTGTAASTMQGITFQGIVVQ